MIKEQQFDLEDRLIDFAEGEIMTSHFCGFLRAAPKRLGEGGFGILRFFLTVYHNNTSERRMPG